MYERCISMRTTKTPLVVVNIGASIMMVRVIGCLLISLGGILATALPQFDSFILFQRRGGDDVFVWVASCRYHDIFMA